MYDRTSSVWSSVLGTEVAPTPSTYNNIKNMRSTDLPFAVEFLSAQSNDESNEDVM